MGLRAGAGKGVGEEWGWDWQVMTQGVRRWGWMGGGQRGGARRAGGKEGGRKRGGEGGGRKAEASREYPPVESAHVLLASGSPRWFLYTSSTCPLALKGREPQGPNSNTQCTSCCRLTDNAACTHPICSLYTSSGPFPPPLPPPRSPALRPPGGQPNPHAPRENCQPPGQHQQRAGCPLLHAHR